MAEVKINQQSHAFERVYHVPKEQLANALRTLPHNGTDDYVFRVEDDYFIASRQGESIPLPSDGAIRFSTESYDHQQHAQTDVTVSSSLHASMRADGVVKYQGKAGFLVAVDNEINTREEGKATVRRVKGIVAGVAGSAAGFLAAGLTIGVVQRVAGQMMNSPTLEKAAVGIALVGTVAGASAAAGLRVKHNKEKIEAAGEAAANKPADYDMLADFSSKVDQ